MSNQSNPDLERLLTSARELPGLVLPIYEYAETIEPDAIFVCDRDARPIGVALEAIRERDDDGLPTVGDKWYYRHISGRMTPAELGAHLIEPLTEIQSQNSRPKIMVVDDYVSKRAGTLSAFRETCADLGVEADIRWATLSGRGTSFNANPFSGAAALAPWRDRPDVIGIDYHGINLVEQPTKLSTAFYETIAQAAEELDL